jgi:hypothetical protein
LVGSRLAPSLVPLSRLVVELLLGVDALKVVFVEEDSDAELLLECLSML